jgi:nucleoside-diphosphate-sugar epimerase
VKIDILLTGASGFLGREIIDTLGGRYNFVTLGRQSPILGDRHIGADLTAGMVINLPAVKYVIHCAGKAHSIPDSVEEKEAFYKVNFQGTVNLCQSLEKAAGIPEAFVFISTVAVYGKEEGVLIAEDHPLEGDTPYAKSKIMAEQYLEEWCSKHHVKLSILRLPLIAGNNPPGNLKTMIKGIRSGKYLSIGKANAKKSIVWAKDIAGIIPTAAETGGIYNLTDGDHPSFRELEHCIARGMGKKDPWSIPLPVAKLMALTGDILGNSFPVNSKKLRKIITTLTFSDQKAQKALNWKPSVVTDKIRFIV